GPSPRAPQSVQFAPATFSLSSWGIPPLSFQFLPGGVGILGPDINHHFTDRFHAGHERRILGQCLDLAGSRLADHGNILRPHLVPRFLGVFLGRQQGSNLLTNSCQFPQVPWFRHFWSVVNLTIMIPSRQPLSVFPCLAV